jgi:iron complex outermembrane recepter protein
MVLAMLAGGALAAPAAGQAPQGPPPADPPAAEAEGDLTELSIEELMSIEVTSVSKRPEAISQAAAAVFVLTQEDLRRAGVTNLPDALRLVPGVQVARATSSVWAISARGFNGRFANKLLVLIDGRSVYTPLFSGVFWDVQGTLLEDVERIEVIRGPGAALWGANAVNGVINVITKRAADTQGTLVRLAAGSEIDALAAVRHGGGGGRTAWRVFAERSDRDGGEPLDALPPVDGWSLTRGGFRLDRDGTAGGVLTAQGGVYDGASGERLLLASPLGEPRATRVENDLGGGHLSARWSRTASAASHWVIQGYVDRTERAQPILAERRTTFDLELQHSLSRGRQEIVWGAGYRRSEDTLRGSEAIVFRPAERSDDLWSAFVQDQVAAVPGRVWLTVGAKLEENDYTGFEVQPSVRALWIPRAGHTLWTAVSRAVRTPSRAEADLELITAVFPPDALFPGSPPASSVVRGSDRFDSEELIAYEAGYRVGLGSGLFLDVAAFHNRYDELRDVRPEAPELLAEPPPRLVVPATIVNLMHGHTQGLEVAAEWWVADRWRLTAAYSLLDMDLESRGGAGAALPGAVVPVSAEVIEGESPEQQLAVRSSWDLGRGAHLDLVGRWVGALPAQGIDDYLEADLRLGWSPRPNLSFELVGRNLLDDSHAEFVPEIIPTQPTAIERSVHASVAWRF